MVSTYEQVSTNRYFSRFGFEYDRQYVYCREPEEIVEAKEEQQEQLKGDAGLLDFDGLDANAIEADVLADTTEDLEFSMLDINFLDVDFLQDLLEEIEEVSVEEDKGDSGSESEGRLAADKITGTAIGFDPETQFNTVLEDGKLFF